jgi:hypothetical protein
MGNTPWVLLLSTVLLHSSAPSASQWVFFIALLMV